MSAAFHEENKRMKYMLLMYWHEEESSHYTPEETREKFQASLREWNAFESEVKAAGVWVDSNTLNSVNDATSVRVREGKTLITDGPFAETHEQFGGYYMLDCKDLDEVLAWAAKIPVAKYGTVEVRPLNKWSQK
jgi:hypothetical protein